MKVSLKTTIEATALIILSLVVIYITAERTTVAQGLLFGFVSLVLGIIVLSTIELVIITIDSKTGG